MEALRESERKYRILMEQASEAIFVQAAPDEVFIEVNTAACEMVGYSRDELLRLQPADILEPEDDYSRASRHGELRTGATLVTQRIALHKDGSRFRVELRTKVLPDGRVQTFATDVSEREAAADALRQSERYFRSLTEHALDVVLVLNSDATIRYASSATERVLGYKVSERIGRSAFELIHPLDLPRLQNVWAQALREPGTAITTTLRLSGKDGRWRTLELRATNLLEEPSVAGVVINANDLTVRLEHEKQVRVAERLASMGTLVSGVAHELNNPLHAVQNFAALLLMDETVPERREDLEAIVQESERMARIVSDLGQIARHSQALDELRTPVHLNDVVRRVLHTRSYSLRTRNVEVREDLSPDAPEVFGDHYQIEEAVLHLVINAEQAMAADEIGRRRALTVATRPSGGGGTILEIADTGPGIPEEDLERIFDPFWTTKAPGEGTGLGLSLVHRVVTEHDGSIRVDSVPGQGATFHLEFPPPRDEPPATEPAPPSEQPSPAGLHVLVVDDEPGNRSVLTRLLERRGHRTDEAEEGQAALRLLDANDYDVIISDLRMPGMGGDELFARLRERHPGMEERLMFVTGDIASGDVQRVLKQANVPVLLKPIDIAEAALAIERRAEEAGRGPGA